MRYYQGLDKRRSYFEGWYFKLCGAAGTLAFIPGVSMDSQGGKEAFLQIVTPSQAFQLTYPFPCFAARTDRLAVRLPGGLFTAEGVSLDVRTSAVTCRGLVHFGPLLPPSSDVMGPFRFVPGMECHHGVLSLAHALSGQITLQGETWDFDGGIGYIEKDWGRSFPSSYIWAQCNDLGDDIAVMASAADIPFLGARFGGCIAIVEQGGRQYRFATYHGARIRRFHPQALILEQGSHRLEIHPLEQAPVALRAPLTGRMTRTIREHPACRVRFRYSIEGWTIFDRVGTHAGFEYVGRDA